jgi:two-component system OmpR family response regulator
VSHVLVADDDAHIREVVRFALEKAGHRVSEAADGRETLALFERDTPELVVLDIVMPEHDGLEVCRRLRERSAVPILFLSSRDEELDRILGLEMGADDYVTKPFSPRELAARVKAMLRRASGAVGPDADPGNAGCALSHGALVLDPMKHECRWDGEVVFLTATEFLLLRSLLAVPQKVYTREELVERAYGHGHHITGRTVDSHVRRIRKKFGALGVDPVETVYGVGYRLRAAAESGG